ncbi:hypothetical protein BDZ85DRAFT_3872 [Elsinoe ampelina]|uniref:Gfd2/YDR514C-like C-terminal domain-containing protein n=1 Tax=Elsinoe ampelina TaxID=302913 RepID=A0A6A6GP48_9PEZI|nr:hypothetical protein BDZ85DRAFT_3872 [Elsinoe ampelina]
MTPKDQPDRDEIFDKVQALFGLPQVHNASSAFDPETCTQIRPLKDAVFMAIDIEACETDQSKITEVGIAMLDTRVTRRISPGEGAAAWTATILARHYITKDFIELENTKYVKGGEPGTKQDFAYGTSQVISIGKLKNWFRYDLGHPPYPDGDVKERRPIVLVGHGMQNDLKYLEAMKIRLESDANVVEKIDTQDLCSYRSLPASLEAMLSQLGIDTTASHNAGNDAARTLEALVKMVFLNAYYPKMLHDALKTTLNPPITAEDLP